MKKKLYIITTIVFVIIFCNPLIVYLCTQCPDEETAWLYHAIKDQYPLVIPNKNQFVRIDNDKDKYKFYKDVTFKHGFVIIYGELKITCRIRKDGKLRVVVER